MKFLTQTTPWMIASMLIANSAFAQDACHPCPPTCAEECPDPCCPPWPMPLLNAAYNYPAAIQTRCAWNLSFDASFLYWQPIQENLEPGLASPNLPPFSIANPRVRDVINFDVDFKPGFQVSCGWKTDYDGWDTHAEYTWFHSTQHQFSNAPEGSYLLPHWAAPANEYSNVYNSANEHWNLKLDIIDADLGRCMYVGTKLVVRPYGGARAAWIRETVNVQYVNTGTPAASAIAFLADNNVHMKSNSWALGPRGGIDANWNLGKGFRFFGNSSADILFTRYTKLLREVTNEAFSTPVTTPPVGGTIAALTYTATTNQKNYNCLRTHLDIDIGIGWGTYWDCNNWYTDIALGYEFQVFFDQNMFRHVDYTTGNSFTPNGNLYIQGLTAKFRLDF